MARHFVSRLYEASTDFPYRGAGPIKTYMIATTPRCGSTHFCMELWRAGCFGAPMEYLNLRNRDNMIARLSPTLDLSEYWHNVQNIRTSPNGVFGFKMFFQNFRYIAKQHPALLAHIASQKVIMLKRRDRVAQAISYARAMQTSVWFAGMRNKVPPVYNYGEIRRADKMLRRQNAAWDSAFALTDEKPLTIYHEDFCRDPARIYRKIALFLGIDLAASKVIQLEVLERQADEISDDWTARFLQDGGFARRGDKVETRPFGDRSEGPSVKVRSA